MYSSTLSKPAVMLVAMLVSTQAAESSRPVSLQIEGGLVTFDVSTNISAVSVHGKSSGVRGVVRAHKDNARLVVDEVNATLPVDAISTGMGLRDEHMKKYIFTTADHQVPDLKFSSANVTCPVDASGGEASCKFPGKLTIRGVEKPVVLTLKLRASTNMYRAVGDITVKLSEYGIERPSQFGVKCADEVRIHLEIQGRETVEATSRVGGAN